MPSKKAHVQPITFEDARIIFRNFQGAEGKYNPKGKRNFNLVLDPELGEQMLADGWNVKRSEPREEGDEPLYRVEVAVEYDRGKPPKVWVITSNGRTQLTPEMLIILDWAEFDAIDLIIRPYEWEVNGRRGIKAYLQTLFATIHEDDLEKKYADVPDSGQSALTYSEDEEPRTIQASSEVLAITRGQSPEE